MLASATSRAARSSCDGLGYRIRPQRHFSKRSTYPCFVTVVRSTRTKASTSSRYASPCGCESIARIARRFLKSSITVTDCRRSATWPGIDRKIDTDLDTDMLAGFWVGRDRRGLQSAHLRSRLCRLAVSTTTCTHVSRSVQTRTGCTFEE